MFNTKLTIRNGYLITEISESSYLVDTGVQFSIGAGQLRIGKVVHHLSPAPIPGFNIATVNQHLGVDFKGIIGLDIMRHHGCEIDAPNQKITFGLSSPILNPKSSTNQKVGKRHGYLSLPVRVDGKVLNLIFDTGAPVGYFCRPDLTNGKVIAKRGHRDFIALSNSVHQTDLFEVTLQLDNLSSTLKFGTAPAGLPAMLKPFDVDGVFGAELCSQFKITVSPDQDTPILTAA